MTVMSCKDLISVVAIILLFQAGCQPNANQGGGVPNKNADNGAKVAADGTQAVDRDVAPDPLCECIDPADQDLIDVEEDMLPKFAERQIRLASRIVPPDSDEVLKVFFGNLHSHTSYSDGSGLPGEAFLHARDSGELDFLALTEHNHRSAGSDNGRRIADHPDRYAGPRTDGLIPVANGMTQTGVFVAIYGQEFSTISKGNHINIFDVPQVVDDGEVENGRFDTLLNTWMPANLDTSGAMALLQLNHPWTSDSPNNKEYGRDDFDDFETWRSTLDAHAELIEVINGPSHEDAAGVEPATVNASEFRRYLAMGFHLAPTANQDNHFKTWGTITHARTAVLAPELSKTAIMSSLRNRQVYASLDKNLRLIAKVQGKPIGSILTTPIATGTELAVEISIQDDDQPSAKYWVEVFADNVEGSSAGTNVQLVATYGPLDTESSESNVWNLPGLIFGDWDYLYMRVLRGPANAPKQQAYLAPVWFESP